MELRSIIWHWDSLLGRLQQREPDLYRPLRRSCQPLEAERRHDGMLTLAIGCWVRDDLVVLSREGMRDRLSQVLGRMMEDRMRLAFAPWPVGMAEHSAAEEVSVPDILAGLPQEARDEATLCESPVQRFFYAAAHRRGLRPRCQYQLQRYRLDFALVERRAAAEVVGWEWNRGPRGAGAPREREEELGVANWRVRWFSGSQVLADVERCLDEFERLSAGEQGLFTRRLRAQTQQPGGFRTMPRYGRSLPPRRRPPGRT